MIMIFKKLCYEHLLEIQDQENHYKVLNNHIKIKKCLEPVLWSCIENFSIPISYCQEYQEYTMKKVLYKQQRNYLKNKKLILQILNHKNLFLGRDLYKHLEIHKIKLISLILTLVLIKQDLHFLMILINLTILVLLI